MDGTLKLVSKTLAYADLGETSNPTKRFADWSAQQTYQVRNPKTEPYTIAPGDTLAVFSGVRSTSVANDTEFTLTTSLLSATRYRFTHSAGAAPALRTARAVDLSGVDLTLTVNANSTLTLVADAVTPFSAVQVGDIVFIPGASTGDAASPFDSLNEGYWTVLAVTTSSTTLQLARPLGAGFAAFGQTVTPDDAAEVQIFSAAGVQVGDKVTISVSFVASVQNTYEIVAVNPSWFEVVATQPMPTGITGVPTTSGIVFYTNAKRYVRFQADQECVVRLNGDATDLNRLSPWTAGDMENAAPFEKGGPTWSASVVNKSSEPLNIIFISVE